MPSVTLEPLKPKLNNLQAFLKNIEAKNKTGKTIEKGNLIKIKIYTNFEHFTHILIANYVFVNIFSR